MLPVEHMRVFRRKEVIKPILIEDQTSLAKTLIAVYRDHIGKKRGELNDALSDCEELGYDFRLVRGMASVLETRVVFKVDSKVPPILAREEIFKEAAQKIVTDDKDRAEVLRAVSRRLKVTPEELDESLYGDLEDEQTLTEFREPTSEELNRYYNFANTVALLAYSREIKANLRDNDDHLRLLAERIGDTSFTGGNQVSSLLIKLNATNRLAQRGSRIDEFVSSLLRQSDWDLQAEIVYPTRNRKKCVLKMSKTDHGHLLESDPIQGEDQIMEIVSVPKKSVFGDLVIIEDLARRGGVTEAEALRQIKNSGQDYVDLGGVLVTKQKLHELREALMKITTLDEARQKLKSQGVSNFMPVLQALGYYIDWAKPRGESRVYRL
jgi:predicted nuclease of restriction endonuclease-like RecB superfamily